MSLYRGAAEPLGLFGGRSTLEVRLLAIFRSCCTTDQRLCAGLYLYHMAVQLDELVVPGGKSSPHHPSRVYVHLIAVEILESNSSSIRYWNLKNKVASDVGILAT